MRVIDARPDPADEHIVATAVCKECTEEIDKWCIPIEHSGNMYPPEYLWRHRDGTVVCGFTDHALIATPREGTICHV